ncbi:MAG: coproporphyrinogen dehydrogenase HemZ [Butyricicoccus sp.]|nr:coproporphyrinogen dehydrogenase HemZ [Butyricicoccus sp.]
MIYVLQGHDLKHAVEEMLLHLLPTERPVYASEPPAEGDCCISRLELDGGTARAQAEVRLEGRTETAERSASVEGLTGLAQKRVVTEIVKLALYDAMAPRLAVQPAWGSLTGVRPAKLARGLMARGLTRGQTAQRFRERYGVTAERTALTMRAAAFAQAALERLPENEVSLYIGIPFCPSRCAYCSFVSHSIEKSAALIPPYVDALCAELADTGALLREGGLRVSSIYIGGGTPTTLSPEELTRLMDSVSRHFDLSHLQEYTVEAGRPDTITREKLVAIRAGGAGRVSINPQSMNDAVLQNIGRRHTAHEVLEAYALAREIGFDVINMDTIAGLEGDTPESFAHTIDTLIGLGPENITVHTLAIKRGADLTDKGANAAQHDRVQAMLAAANAALSAAGYGPYYLYRQKFTAGGFENVGWCKPDTENLYNIAMMEELQTIVSAGAGGVSKRVDRASGKITRFTNPKYPKEYIEAGERCLLGKRRLLL